MIAPEHRVVARPARDLPEKPYRFSQQFIPGAVKLGDCAALALAALTAWIVVAALDAPETGELSEQHLLSILWIISVYLIIAMWANLYHFRMIVRPLAALESITTALVVSFALHMSQLMIIVNSVELKHFYFILCFLIFSSLFICIVRFLFYYVLNYVSRKSIVGNSVAIIGTGAQGAALIRQFTRNPPHFASLFGVFTLEPSENPSAIEGAPVLGDLRVLLETIRDGKVDDVIVALPWSENDSVIATVERLKELPVNVYLGSDLIGFELAFRPVFGMFSESTVFEVMQRPISGWGAALKGIFDFVAAAIGLLLLVPLFAVIAVAIKLDTAGPVFFKQMRLGYNNKPFLIYKFRSMRHEPVPETVVVQAHRRDARITRVGRFIRATSLDELPQLINVLNGTMSLVGPRPHAISHNEEYGRFISGYFARHKVKPGITGLAQIRGFRGETRDPTNMLERVKIDVYYAENWSFFLDVKIIIFTCAVVLFQRNAY